MPTAGLTSPWPGLLGSAGGLTLSPPPLAPPPTPPTELLGRMLRRLPPSLWNVDPESETLQRDVYRAFAAQMAVWLENREIARQMTLLLEADGIDLDVLLQDYGLKRYLQRPDEYARQIAMQILWTSKETLWSVSRLADLLFTDLPHTTLRTGRSEVHVIVADTHPVVTPYHYWGMISREGVWYALWVDAEAAVVSTTPPPGLNTAPGPHTLSWFLAKDELNHNWYVTIEGDALAISQVQPLGYATATPFQVQDAQGQLWTFAVDSVSETLITVPGATGQPPFMVLSPQHPFQALQLRDSANVVWWLSIDGNVLQTTATLPGGATDVTPAGGPYRWLRVYDAAGALWYAYPLTDGTLFTDTTTPGGLGTAVPQSLGDAHGVLWHYGIALGGGFATSDAPHVAYGQMATTICLNDRTGARWFWRVNNGTLEWSHELWPNAIDQSPWGELGWIFLHDSVTGAPAYVFPQTTGVPQATLGAPMEASGGWSQPVTLRDNLGQSWHLRVASGVVDVEQDLTDDIPGLADPLPIRDAQEAIGHVQAAGSLVTILVS